MIRKLSGQLGDVLARMDADDDATLRRRGQPTQAEFIRAAKPYEDAGLSVDDTIAMLRAHRPDALITAQQLTPAQVSARKQRKAWFDAEILRRAKLSGGTLPYREVERLRKDANRKFPGSVMKMAASRVDAALEALVNRSTGIQKVAWRPYQPAGAPPRPPRPPSPVFPGGGRVGQGGAPGGMQPWRQPGGTLNSTYSTMPTSARPNPSPVQGMQQAQARFSGHTPQPAQVFTPPAPMQPQRAPALPQGTVPGTRAFGGNGPGYAERAPQGVPTDQRTSSARIAEAVARQNAAIRTEQAAEQAAAATARRDGAIQRLSDNGVNLNTASDDDMRAWLRSQGLL